MLKRPIGGIFLKIQTTLVANTLFCSLKPMPPANFEKNTPICCFILINQLSG